MDHKERFVEFCKEVGSRVDEYLEKHLPEKSGYALQLKESMRYSIFAGGKRIRPVMACITYQACGGHDEIIYYATSALEMLHTFSLIHDDLPCMDDDDLRRGRPTNHKIFGEATAVLAGDALCIHAFELLAKTGNLKCIETISSALGAKGMIGGQMEDILSEGKPADLEKVNWIHLHKTAALIEASLVLGAQLAGANDNAIEKLSKYGNKIGLAFQIVDDVLDLEQTTESLGKDAGSDISKLKATYPAVLGLQSSKEKARKLMESSINDLQGLSIDTSMLIAMAEFIVTRVN